MSGFAGQRMVDDGLVVMETSVTTRSERGFTLVELIVVVGVIGLLLGMAIPAYAGFRSRASDVDAQSDLRAALLLETLYYVENGTFTKSALLLESAAPQIDFNVAKNPPGTVRVKARKKTLSYEVCLFAQSTSGTWFAIYHSVDEGTFYGNSKPKACKPKLKKTFSQDGW